MDGPIGKEDEERVFGSMEFISVSPLFMENEMGPRADDIGHKLLRRIISHVVLPYSVLCFDGRHLSPMSE